MLLLEGSFRTEWLQIGTQTILPAGSILQIPHHVVELRRGEVTKRSLRKHTEELCCSNLFTESKSWWYILSKQNIVHLLLGTEFSSTEEDAVEWMVRSLTRKGVCLHCLSVSSTVPTTLERFSTVVPPHHWKPELSRALVVQNKIKQNKTEQNRPRGYRGEEGPVRRNLHL